MSRLISFLVVGLYVSVLTLVLGINWQGQKKRSGIPHWPELKIIHEVKPETNWAFPSGIPKLDLAAVKSSINRLPAIGLARQLGNSLRIACGQRLDWVIWGSRQPIMLFPVSELWASEGINAGRNREVVEGATLAVRKFAGVVKAEGWTLIVVPVPTKLSIHRALCQWPVLDKDPLSRRPVTQDRADEILDTLFQNFTRDGVPFVDLRVAYRTHLATHPTDLIFPPGESHWSGLGIRLAAEATAAKIAGLTNIPLKQITPAFLEVDRVGDMASSFDPYSGWLSRLQPVYSFHDRLVNGEQHKGYIYATDPNALLVVAGTSYTGQYTWLVGQPVGFTWVIGGLLEQCEIQNRPFAGMGSFYAFRRFLDDREAISRDFAQRKSLPTFTKVVVWEFPLRDLAVVVGQ